MLAIGFLVFRLISDSEQGKADARANGLATAAASLYLTESAAARADARTIASDAVLLAGRPQRARLSALATQSGLARVTLSRGARVLADVGDPSAVAPGVAKVNRPRAAAIAITVSTISAAEYARDLTGRAAAVVIRRGWANARIHAPDPPGCLLADAGGGNDRKPRIPGGHAVIRGLCGSAGQR